MIEIIALADGVHNFGPTVLGLISLLASRISGGGHCHIAQHFFMAALALVTLVTIQTAIACDKAWLMHTMTLMIMIVGAVVVPANQAVDQGI